MDPKNKSIPIYRLAVLGMMSVGKTSIISRFVNNNFESQYEETNDDIRFILIVSLFS
jgi:GTPase SAR1 family protein